MAVSAGVLERPSEAPRDYPPARQGAVAVGVLFFAYVVAHLDRSVMAILTPSLKAGLGVNDTQVSLLLSAHASGQTFGGLIPAEWPAWKAVFLIIGAPGLVVAAALLLLREPERRELELTAASGAGGPTLSSHLRAHPATYACRCAILSLILLTCSARANVGAGFLTDALTRWRPLDGRSLYSAVALAVPDRRADRPDACS